MFKPATPRRRETMLTNLHRQLVVTLLSAMVVLSSSSGRGATETSQDAVRELQAAALLETTLQAGKAGKADWDRMEQIYAGLAQRFPKEAAVLNAYGAFLLERGKAEQAEGL